MNEEEALEIFKNLILLPCDWKITDKYKGTINFIGAVEGNEAIEIISNLIEKLQKENEELKEYITIAPNLDEMTAVKYRNIQQDAYIKGRADEQQKAEQIIYENHIPVQEVKDKIEELNSRIEKYREYVEQGIETDIEWVHNVADRETVKILQELIEGRE